ncbi:MULTISPECIES: septum formation family protein [unclassified Microbacterium]|uniref:septum formation family protein n=1 Tax=unclassified Microbacterium TaxID=2609290 RepID=UPI00214C7749|nr:MULTISPECIES: septum formation family protein [unclassified Microbacterium]MCR2786070.1 septum formation family protein [Microbacterium sp. zg.B96]MDL5353102.1 septum formation family protein [Microbacterium sp. zg-YB36]WIM17005.1 septum formation family protein [Microbacterium sp. zg-B96]
MKLAHPKLAAAAVVAIGMMALSGCGSAQFPTQGAEPERDESSGEITESNDSVDVFSIRVGDCLNTSELTGETEVESVPVVPCDEEHEDEVYYGFDTTTAGSEFPGEEALAAEADETCIAEFAGFVGVSYEESALEYWPMYPSEGSWAGDDREILCMVYDPAGMVTGTLAGAAR